RPRCLVVRLVGQDQLRSRERERKLRRNRSLRFIVYPADCPVARASPTGVPAFASRNLAPGRGIGRLSTMMEQSVDARIGSSCPESGDRGDGTAPFVAVRHDWRREEIRAVHEMPLLELVFRAADVHRRFHPGDEVQVCRLISIKTGSCPEDCAYCAQSARYQTGIEPQALMDKETVVAVARRARDHGVSRICLGAGGRAIRDTAQFESVVEMDSEGNANGQEVC